MGIHDPFDCVLLWQRCSHLTDGFRLYGHRQTGPVFSPGPDEGLRLVSATASLKAGPLNLTGAGGR